MPDGDGIRCTHAVMFNVPVLLGDEPVTVSCSCGEARVTFTPLEPDGTHFAVVETIGATSVQVLLEKR